MYYVIIKYPHTGKTKKIMFTSPHIAEGFALSANLVGAKANVGYDKAITLGDAGGDILVFSSWKRA